MSPHVAPGFDFIDEMPEDAAEVDRAIAEQLHAQDAAEAREAWFKAGGSVRTPYVPAYLLWPYTEERG